MFNLGLWSLPHLLFGLGSAVVGLVSTLFGLLIYLLFSYGLFLVAQKDGHPQAWLAWIPFARDYLIGDLEKEIYIGNSRITNLGIVYLIASIVGSANGILGLLFAVFSAWVFINFYRKRGEQNDILFGILTAIPVVRPFVMIIFASKYKNR